MKSKAPPRNRLAKPLPREWQDHLLEAGVPKRKYTAILRAELVGGIVIEEMIVEQGWIVALDRAGLVGQDERAITMDPRQITKIDILQVI